MSESTKLTTPVTFNPAEIGALSHLYRGEMYRSKVWRTRLDTTTNWAVGTTGLALSLTFGLPESSPLPLFVVSLLVSVFLGIEARRYRYFDMWRTRVRVLETSFFNPILRGEGIQTGNDWSKLLADDYETLQFHISFSEALGRRLRRNYLWIFLILGLSYMAKVVIHPVPLMHMYELWERMAIGPLHGRFVMILFAVWYGGIVLVAVMTLRGAVAVGRVHGPDSAENQVLKTRLKLD